MTIPADDGTRISVPEQKHGHVYGYGEYPWLRLRGIVGGVFMGLAGVVPGVSGGTMLLASGVYPFFMEGLHDVASLRFRRRSVLVLAIVLTSALLSVGLLGPAMRAITTSERWMSFSLFAGLAAGGMPVVAGMAKPYSGRTTGTALAGFVFAVSLISLRVLMEVPIDEKVGAGWYFLGGLLAGGAMVLPGISGAYLMVLLGVYMPIMDALDVLRIGFVTGEVGPAVGRAAPILGPAAAGVALGIHLLSRTFHRLLVADRRATMGMCLGLLAGALVELWPFQQAAMPHPGDVLGGRTLTAEDIAALPSYRFPSEYFTPDAKQVVTALVLFGLGFAITALGTRIGGRHESGYDLAGRTQA